MKKPPGYIVEVIFVMTLIFFLKMYSDAAFEAFTFMMMLLPILIYFVVSIVMDIIKFIQQLHVEDYDEEDGFLTSK